MDPWLQEHPEIVAALRADQQQRNGAGPAGTEVGSSWGPVDLAALIAAGLDVEQPFRLARADGVRLLYQRKLHVLQGEPEAGKGWLALAATVEHIRDGRRVLYLDFEDVPRTFAGRLLALGLDAEAIAAHVTYVRPEEGLTDSAWDRLASTVDDTTLAILDGTTEAMTLQGLSLLDNADVAQWLALLPRRLRDAGATVVLIDHVVKDSQSRGRYGLGAQHKLAGVDVAYTCEMVEPFGRGREGRAKISIAKDRPGAVREHAADGWHVANVRLLSHADGRVDVTLLPPEEGGHGGAEWQPTWYMEQVSRAVEREEGINASELRAAVTGRTELVTTALRLLVRDGHVRVDEAGRSKRHFAVVPYRQPDEGESQRDPVPTCSDLVPGTGLSDVVPMFPPRRGNREQLTGPENHAVLDLVPGTRSSDAGHPHPVRPHPVRRDPAVPPDPAVRGREKSE